MKRRTAVVTLSAALLWLVAAAPQDSQPLDLLRQKAERIMRDGNHKEAYDLFERLALDPANDPRRVGGDLVNGVSCLQALNRVAEEDAFREKVVGVHSNNWRLLRTAAQSYFEGTAHYGTLVAGEFERGPHRGGGRFVETSERDRIRALQLMDLALAPAENELATPVNKPEAGLAADLAAFHLLFARMLMGHRGYGDAWRLQYLTDLSALPDPEEGYGRHGNSQTGAPVDDQGTPVFHRLPDSYVAATTDGERWRWFLHRAMAIHPANSSAVLTDFAQFLHQQFGVQTLAQYGLAFQDDDAGLDETGPFELHTLKETETMARLASGVRRFLLPDEFNPIRIFQQIADSARDSWGEQALHTLASIFEDRRQYDRAVDAWTRSIKTFGEGHGQWKQKRIDQILGNWGRFEPMTTHPAGSDASFDFCFRNGSKVEFSATEIDVAALLNDVKDYLKSEPKQVEWNRINVADLGYLFVEKQGQKYLRKEAARWDVALQPRDMHFDRRITVKAPLSRAGAYLVVSRMENGNESRIILWLNDTAIAKKQLDGQALLFVADAVTGKPLPGINVEFFGYRQEWRPLTRHYDLTTSQFALNTDDRGQLMLGPKDVESKYQWLIVATTPEGRLAYLGFNGIWYGARHDAEYNMAKLFCITDRPVYRPSQNVKFKLWLRHARYDQEDTSSFARQGVTVVITNPKGDKLLEKPFTTDEFGGLDGELPLPADATLGVYGIAVRNVADKDPRNGNARNLHLHGGNFRVEEYKKPEFEVTVESPTEPVKLGDTITASIKARYYFGAPVSEARVKYKILRSSYTANWYPIALWDWFYGPGYWWFGYDYAWYPGWREWGCRRPSPWWWPRAQTPPEVVAEAEIPLPEDGNLKIAIDTALAAKLHGNTDHRYELTAEVTDKSRRTIVGQGSVLVARKPFKVYTWVDRGHYRVGDTIQAGFSAQTLDHKPVEGQGRATLSRITYEHTETDVKPVEKLVQEWPLDTNPEGQSSLQIQASQGGQYRLSYSVTDAKKNTIEGAYVFCVMGDGDDGRDFAFNQIELVQDKKDYRPGDKVRLRINTEHPDSTVLLFLRPANGVYIPPETVSVPGKSALREIEITKKDMPNFFIEAITIRNGRIHTEVREIVVPPEKRVLNLEVLPSLAEYKPGQKATVKVKVTDFFGKPFAGTAAISVYDKSVEYISGGSNVPEIREFFWKWRRHHSTATESSLDRYFAALIQPNEIPMQAIGAFGHAIADEDKSEARNFGGGGGPVRMKGLYGGGARGVMRKSEMVAESDAMAMPAMAMAAVGEGAAGAEAQLDRASALPNAPGEAPTPAIQPMIRKSFADTAFWAASLRTDDQGLAEVTFPMPENLTTWKIKTWALGHGTVVGEAAADVVTTKKLVLRLQAPRFFVEKDEVVLSANIHNYLKAGKAVKAVLESEGGCLELPANAAQTVQVAADGETRVDWRVRVVREGEAVVRMQALTDEESDAMEMRFPVYVHGMLKTDSRCGVIRPDKDSASFTLTVPAERRIEQTVLELRYSPTLAAAMVDALPYLADYPYGCTEQTLNRFLPTIITQKVLKDLGLNLKDIRDKLTNLNAQEIGNDKERAGQWKRGSRNAVFDEETVGDMVFQGLKALTAMQLSDGGWGWFSGWGEHSYPHTTATVIHGLQIARENGVALVPGVLERGIQWLEGYQAVELKKLRNAEKKIKPWKSQADDLDAFVYMVLVDAGKDSADMRDFLYRDRVPLSVYAKAMLGLALHKQGQTEKLDMILRNIEQFLVQDEENQTAWLNLGNASTWWYWYGSENEAHAYYLKLLSRVEPKSDRASRLVKYLLNNRKHATYWQSTRDTALCVEAMADYLRASGEDKPDMTIEIFVDGQKKKEVAVNPSNLFSFDNRLVISGPALSSGSHTVEVRRKGTGPVYFNAYLTNFTLEDFITRAGLEIKVDRKVYRLVEVDKKIKVAGSRGQALDQKVEKYERRPLKNLDTLKSGDLVEVELEIESKNDYEYILFEDMKAAGFEPVEVRSGYNGNDMGAYVEFRDERVAFFIRALARGRHSVAYRLRAEIPGRFSALPTRASAMYAPELKANSDEIKLNITD